MKLDRYMANLFFEIRRNIPHRMQSEMRISDPGIGDYMVKLYQEIDDENIKLLTEIFLERAGEEWLSKIHPGRASTHKRYYRGQEIPQVEEDDAIESIIPMASKPKSQRIYRGQVIVD